MFINVERDQFLKRADRVEHVQVQPLVFQRAPPRFDERVGEGDLRPGEKASKEARFNELVDGAVEVFDAAVDEHGWLLIGKIA